MREAAMDDERPIPSGISPLAVASLICGIIWVCGVGSVLAVVFGQLALRRVRRTGQPGRSLAIIGVLLGYAGILVTLVILLNGGVWVRVGPDA
jgi:hypothetical protein